MINVPKKLFIQSEAFDEPSLSSDPIVAQLPTLQLSLNLIKQLLKKEKSFFVSYLNLLPKTLKSCPLTYSLEQIQQLKGSFLQCKVYIQVYVNILNILSIKNIKNNHKIDELLQEIFQQVRLFLHVQQLLSKSTVSGILTAENVTWDLFIWSRWMCMSRQNQFLDKDQVSLCPLYDLMNYSPRSVSFF